MPRISITSGNIQEGGLYLVEGGSITYDGNTINDGESFEGTAITTFSTASGSPVVSEDTQVLSVDIGVTSYSGSGFRYPGNDSEISSVSLVGTTEREGRLFDESSVNSVSLCVNSQRERRTTIIRRR